MSFSKKVEHKEKNPNTDVYQAEFWYLAGWKEYANFIKEDKLRKENTILKAPQSFLKNAELDCR